MRVLQVTNFYKPYVIGGAEIVIEHLAQGLRDRVEAVSVLSTCSSEAGATSEAVDGVPVDRFFPPNLWWNYDRFSQAVPPGRLAKAAWNGIDLWNPGAARRFDEIIRRRRPDVIHTHNLKGLSPSVWAAARRRSIPIVHTIHDYYLVCNYGNMMRGGVPCASLCGSCRLRAGWHARTTRSVDVLCSPSLQVLENHRSAGVTGKTNRVVRNGIPLQPTLDRSTRTGPLRLLYVGQLAAHKGVRVLLESLAHLPADVRLTIAGRGELAGEVEAAAAADPRLRYIGFIGGAEKEAALQDSDVLLFPSIWGENAPISIIEAMMSGLPVIASNLGAMPEAVEDGRSGLLFTPGDPAALAAAVERLSSDPDLLAALSRGARARGASQSVDAMVTEYLQIYRGLLAG